MSPGPRLAMAWLTRVVAWPALIAGVVFVAVCVASLGKGPANEQPLVWSMTAAGVLVVAMAWWVDRRAAAEIERQAAAARRAPGPRGFDVVRPPPPAGEPAEGRKEQGG